MPRTEVRLYQARDGKVPLLDWLDKLPETVRCKCLQKIEMLAREGHELRRPHADFLKRGIYELRVKRGKVNYRILYFFHGQEVVVISHGTTKEKRVPQRDIDLAIRRKDEYLSNPELHVARSEI